MTHGHDGGFLPEEDLKYQPDARLLKRFWPFVRAYRWQIGISVGLMLVLSAFDLVVPWITRWAVDTHILPQQAQDIALAPASDRINGAMLAGLFLVVIAIARFVLSFAQVVIMELAGQRMMHDLRIGVYTHLQKLPVSFFSSQTVGRLSTRVTNDIENMQEMFTTILTFVMKDVFTLVGISVALLYMDLRLGAAVLTMVAPIVLVTWFFSKKSRGVFRLLRVKTAELNTLFSEATDGIRIVKFFVRHRQMIGRFHRVNHDNYLAGLSQIRLYGLFMPIIDVLGALALALVITYGGGRVVTDHVSIGTLVAVISYTKMFFRPVRDIAEKHNILQNALASGERITQILDKEPEESGGDLTLARIDSLAVQDLSFAYTPGEPVLDQVSFSLNRGEALAVLGPTGSGKTSLVSLIVRFHREAQGQILINGLPIDRYNVRSLRSRIALVTQDPYLFSGTIRENIIPRGSFMSDSDLQEVYRLSHVDSVLDHLPKGDLTRISRGGESLSSGERQLISIARAFAHDPDLIIFDEATSYVDTESEEKIRLAIAGLKQNRTSITIAHRLRSAMTADTILVLQGGRIVESGDHDSLMNARSFYYYFHQAGQTA